MDEADARTPLEIATAPPVAGEIVWLCGDGGPFRIAQIIEGTDEAILCSEDDWQRDHGRRVLEQVNGGPPLSDLSRARGDDNTFNHHLRDGEHLHTLCGRVLVIALDGEINGVTDDRYVSCEECLAIRQEGFGPVILEASDPIRKLMTRANGENGVDRLASRSVLHDALLERFLTEYGNSISDAESRARARQQPFVVAIRPVMTTNALFIVEQLGTDLGTKLSPRGMTDERARRLLEEIDDLEPKIWTGAVITYVADPL